MIYRVVSIFTMKYLYDNTLILGIVYGVLILGMTLLAIINEKNNKIDFRNYGLFLIIMLEIIIFLLFGFLEFATLDIGPIFNN